jgi:hypothetical protein
VFVIFVATCLGFAGDERGERREEREAALCPDLDIFKLSAVLDTFYCCFTERLISTFTKIGASFHKSSGSASPFATNFAKKLRYVTLP